LPRSSPQSSAPDVGGGRPDRLRRRCAATSALGPNENFGRLALASALATWLATLTVCLVHTL